MGAQILAPLIAGLLSLAAEPTEEKPESLRAWDRAACRFFTEVPARELGYD